MATILIPVIPVIIGVVGALIGKYLMHPDPKLALALPTLVPLPIVVVGVVSALIVHYFTSPAIKYTTPEPLQISPAVTAILSAVLQFITQVVWPLIQQYL